MRTATRKKKPSPKKAVIKNPVELFEIFQEILRIQHEEYETYREGRVKEQKSYSPFEKDPVQVWRELEKRSGQSVSSQEFLNLLLINSAPPYAFSSFKSFKLTPGSFVPMGF